VKCNEAEEILSAYADGEIHGRKAANLKAHLAECRNCSERLEALLIIQNKLRDMAGIKSTGIDISDAVMSSLPVQKRVYLPRLAWGLASILMIAVATYLSIPGTKQSNIVNPPVVVKLQEKHYPKPTKLVTTIQPDGVLPSGNHKITERRTPSRIIHGTGYHKHKSDVTRPKPIQTAQQIPTPDTEPITPVRVATKSQVIDGVTETTIEVTAGSLTMLRAKSNNIEIARDDNAMIVERPPLEVRRSNSSVHTGISGG